MTRDEIVAQLIILLNRHLHDRGISIDQMHYQRHFFKLFVEAYNSDRSLRGDVLHDLLREHWLEVDDGEDTKLPLLLAFKIRWDAWWYAWDHRHEAQDETPLIG